MTDRTEPTDDPQARVRQLLLSGDNLIKNRDNPERFDRARERFTRARAIAVDAELPEGLVALIDLRLAQLPGSA